MDVSLGSKFASVKLLENLTIFDCSFFRISFWLEKKYAEIEIDVFHYPTMIILFVRSAKNTAGKMNFELSTTRFVENSGLFLIH